MRTTDICLTLALLLLSDNVPGTADDLRGLPLPLSSHHSDVSPLLDDATLNDVQLLGDKHAWAVGDRGVIWHSTDGGRSWKLVPSPVACSWRSVCFLTDRVGWIAGGGVRLRGEGTYGVVLQTTDGGETWTQTASPQLPMLHDVQFFDLSEGVAVGESNTSCPTGVLTTSDGGKSWQPVSGLVGDGWRCAAFVDTSQGFVAGRFGRYATVSNGQVQPSPAGATGLRGISGVTIGADHRGWLVGDGGLMLRTDTGGISWQLPQGNLPRGLRDVMDFRAVAAVGNSVWLVGQPGSVIWHSNDLGATWTAQETGNPLPLEAIAFANESHGCAVGAMGRILRTTDGGKTWETIRGDNRRAALLTVHAHEGGVSMNLATKYGRELGYRTVTAIVPRRDIGPDNNDGRTLDVRLHDAAVSAGGNAGTVDWAFPIAAPGLDWNQNELVREWELLTDHRLREKMLSRLVTMLCTWRPDVVIVDDAAEDDAATKLVADAVRLAVHQAALKSEHAELREELKLTTWDVRRLLRRLPSGSGGPVRLDAHEFLPRLGKSVTMAAADPYRLLAPGNVTIGRDESFAPIELRERGGENDSELRDLFTGISLSPGSPARRELMRIDDENLERFQKLAQQQRNFAAYASQMLDDPRHAAQLIGQMKDITAGAPPEQAAEQLFNLAGEYRRRGEWEHAQAVLVELAQHYPNEPAAVEAMCWLLAFWESGEVGWQRLRGTLNVDGSRQTIDGGIVQANLERAIEQARAEVVYDSDVSPTEPERPPIQLASASGQLRVGGVLDQRTAKQRVWLTSADRLAETLRRFAPNEAAAPGRQFLIAALHRKQDRPSQADAIYRRYLDETADGPWNRIAAGELWLLEPTALAAQPTSVCRQTASPPVLDGILDDECWQKADEIPLRNEAEHLQARRDHSAKVSDGGRATVLWAYDRGFLYIAARIPRESSLVDDRPELPGRVDDADLSRHDRLSFAFDIDRDYTTFYEIEVDQRGWSADTCWENRDWNCQRFIAADADDRQWRIEMAIPFQELVPTPPRRGETWAAGITRIIPTIGVESWTYPAGSHPLPEGFGLLRFD